MELKGGKGVEQRRSQRQREREREVKVRRRVAAWVMTDTSLDVRWILGITSCQVGGLRFRVWGFGFSPSHLAKRGI